MPAENDVDDVWEKDSSHRYDNAHTCAATDADYDDILAEIRLLSKVNKGPQGSRTNTKAELFHQLSQENFEASRENSF